MIETVRDVQIPFLSCLLLFAASSKAITWPRGSAVIATPPSSRRPAVLGAAVVAEAVIGVLLLVSTYGMVRLAAVVFFACATSTITQLSRKGSEEGCGCFGGLSTEPPGRRGLARVGLLTVAACGAAGAPRTGLAILAASGPGSALVLAAEAAIVLALSPELDTLVAWVRHSTPCEVRDVPLAETYAALRDSDVWRHYEQQVTSATPVDVWRELCHRYVVYAARVDDRPAQLVFAVPVTGVPGPVRAGVSWQQPVGAGDDDSDPERVHAPA